MRDTLSQPAAYLPRLLTSQYYLKQGINVPTWAGSDAPYVFSHASVVHQNTP